LTSSASTSSRLSSPATVDTDTAASTSTRAGSPACGRCSLCLNAADSGQLRMPSKSRIEAGSRCSGRCRRNGAAGFMPAFRSVRDAFGD
jgi:hypothetical protein